MTSDDKFYSSEENRWHFLKQHSSRRFIYTHLLAMFSKPLRRSDDGASVVVREVVLLSLFDGLGAAAVALAKPVADGNGNDKVLNVIHEYSWELLIPPVAVRHYRQSRSILEYRFDAGPPDATRPSVRDGGATCFCTHRSDVRSITEGTLQKIVEAHGCEVDYIIIAGSPCQDLSSANVGGKGLSGEQSQLFFTGATLLSPKLANYTAPPTFTLLTAFSQQPPISLSLTLVPRAISWLQHALADAQEEQQTPPLKRGRVVFVVENVRSFVRSVLPQSLRTSAHLRLLPSPSTHRHPRATPMYSPSRSRR